MKTFPIRPILTTGRRSPGKRAKRSCIFVRSAGGRATRVRSKPLRQGTISNRLRKNSVGRPGRHRFARVAQEEKSTQDAQKGRPARPSKRRGEAYASVR